MQRVNVNWVDPIYIYLFSNIIYFLYVGKHAFTDLIRADKKARGL
jgi:hypothetical protein